MEITRTNVIVFGSNVASIWDLRNALAFWFSMSLQTPLARLVHGSNYILATKTNTNLATIDNKSESVFLMHRQIIAMANVGFTLFASSCHVRARRPLVKVLETIPLANAGAEKLWVFVLPTQKQLGKNDTDYSNIQIKIYNQDLEEITYQGDSGIGFFSSGKLGSLTGGLLHLDDRRERLSAEAIVELQAEQFRAVVVDKNQLKENQQASCEQKRKNMKIDLKILSKGLLTWKASCRAPTQK